MNGLIVFVLGLATIPAFVAFGCAAVWLENRLRKYPAAYAARMLDARIDAGGRISARNLIRTKRRVLILLKEGPNEPTAERVVKEPFTEPLDDPPAGDEEVER
jgi:hypothetical protein